MWNQILMSLLSSVTPALIQTAQGFALELHKQAKATDNPYDDILAGFLCALLGVVTTKS